MELKDVTALLQDRLTPTMKTARLFYEDDHWQNGKGLVIKKPVGQPQVITQMKEGFCSQNKTAEVVDRRTDGILGREPLWKLIPKSNAELTEAQKKSVAEMVAALVEWWNNRKMLMKMRESHTNACLEERAELRPYVPRAFKVDGKVKQVKTLAEALELLHFENVSPENAGIFEEPDSLKPYSIFKTLRNERTEIDFSFVDGDGITHFKTFTEQEFDKFVTDNFSTSLAKYIVTQTGAKQVGEYSIDLGGKLMLFELNLGKAMISESFQSKQRQLNLNLTMKGRNAYTAGFRERHFLNADEPDNLNLGAGSATYHQGAPIIDNNNQVIGIATPSVTVIDPVDPSSFIKAEESLDRQMLAEVEQRHVGMADDATASGKSRAEARAEFRNSLIKSKLPVDAEGRYIIEFAMMFAAALTGRTSEFEVFRCDFDSIVNAGVPSSDEQEANRKAYEAGEISMETLRSRNGVEDTDSENSKVASEPESELNRLDKALDVVAKGTMVLTLEEQRRILYPNKTDAEIAADLAKLAKENPALAGGAGV
ncbi:MAG TPA: hypothetical protein PKY82_29045 [Pyrinomonadaceae bacterium]|nr:hypothetical protein [Pyrinomonadaceae bacterium]